MFGEHEGDTTLKRLLDALAENKKDAAENILKHSMDRLKSLAHKRLKGFRVVRGAHETDDVVMRAAMRLHKALNEVKPTSLDHFMRLASTQIRRELINLHRHEVGVGKDRVKVVLDPAQATSQIGRVFEQPDAGDTEEQQLRKIDELVDKLTEDEREVFQHVIYQNLPYGDIARILGISETTVKRRWYDAQDTLHRLLGQDQSSR